MFGFVVEGGGMGMGMDMLVVGESIFIPPRMRVVEDSPKRGIKVLFKM